MKNSRRNSILRDFTLQPYCLNAVLIIVVLSLLSCKSESNSPESIVETFSSQVVDAFEKRKRRDLDDFIDDNYLDEENRSKKDLLAIANGYLFRHKSIYCFTHIDSVQLNNDESISAVIFTAFAAKPISDATVLPSMKSDMYWFTIRIAKSDGEWKLMEAGWEQAMVEDLFK